MARAVLIDDAGRTAAIAHHSRFVPRSGLFQFWVSNLLSFKMMTISMECNVEAMGAVTLMFGNVLSCLLAASEA